MMFKKINLKEVFISVLIHGLFINFLKFIGNYNLISYLIGGFSFLIYQLICDHFYGRD